jgi:PAS domain S-box-containing protein
MRTTPGVPPDNPNCQAEVAALRRQIAALEQQVAALQTENAHLHMVADFTYDWEYWIDPAGTLRYVSPACERITGYRPAEFQADAGLLEHCIHPDDRERVARHLDDEQHQPQTCELQFRIIRRDGEQRRIGHACRPVYSAAGEWLGRRAGNRDITAWVQAEEAYHTLVENSLQGLVIFQDGRFVFANPAMVDIIGYSRDELLAFTPDTIQQILHPDDYERVMGYTRARQMGQAVPSTYEVRLIRKDGTIRWVEVAVSLTNYRGRTATQAAYIDITERKQVEEALRASEQQIRRIGNNLPNGIIYQLRQATDGTCTFTYMNDAVERLTGYTAEEIIAQPALVLNSHHEDDQPGYVAAMEEAARTLQPLDFELRQYVADGSLRWRQFYSTPRRESDGTIIWDGICIDITERKQAEEALRASERFVQQIADTMPDILYIFDLTLQRNVYSNRQIAESLDYTPDEVWAMGHAVLPLLLHPDDLPRALHHQTIQAGAPDGVILPFEYRMRHRDGSWRWLLSREVVFSRTDDGKPCRILGIAQDITERKLAEEAYRTLVDNSLQGLTIYQQGRCVFANAAAAQITGYTVAELLALSPAEAAATIHPDDRGMVTQRARERQAGTTVPQHYTFRILHKDGSVRRLEAFAIRVIYQGRPAAQMAYIDITERRQAEDALRASEAQLKAIFDNAAVGIGLTDTSGKLVALNAHGARQLGYTPEEPAHTSNIQLTHPDDQAVTLEHIRQILRGEIDGYRIEKRFIPKDGSLFWADLSVTPVCNPAGQIEYLLGIVVDITERKLAEEALRQYRHIVSASLDSLSLIDRQYIYRVVNNAYLRRTTRSYSEIVGHSVAEIMGADTFAHLLKANLDRCLDGETVHYCAWFDYVDEGRKFMDVTYTPYCDDQDRIQGIVVSARDITHIKQREKRSGRQPHRISRQLANPSIVRRWPAPRQRKLSSTTAIRSIARSPYRCATSRARLSRA